MPMPPRNVNLARVVAQQCEKKFVSRTQNSAYRWCSYCAQTQSLVQAHGKTAA